MNSGDGAASPNSRVEFNEELQQVQVFNLDEPVDHLLPVASAAPAPGPREPQETPPYLELAVRFWGDGKLFAGLF